MELSTLAFKDIRNTSQDLWQSNWAREIKVQKRKQGLCLNWETDACLTHSLSLLHDIILSKAKLLTDL